MSERHTILLAGLLVVGGVTLACSNSEAPAEDHVPVRYEVAVNGTLVTDDTVRLSAGGSDSVRISFYNKSDENLDVAEAEHFSLLTFTPATNITATMDPSHHFRHQVVNTVVAGTAGDLAIGFGHDALADENTFNTKFKFE